MSNKNFWKALKPSLTSKLNFSSDFFRFEINGDLVSDEKKLAEPINENYICIVEKPSGKKSFSVGNKDDSSTDTSKVKEIISSYSPHTRILRVHNEIISKNLLSNKAGTNSAEIKTTIHFANTEKVTGHDVIPEKVVNMSADVINIHVANIIVKDIRQSIYSKNGNTESVRPIFKKRCSNKNKKTMNQ